MQFLQGIDYGARKGTLGWNIHMAEGGDGTARWLAQRSGESKAKWVERVNGVSASFVVQSDGTAIQMVKWDNAAGNLNPRDRSTDKAFYGRRFLLEVLGTNFTDPNAYTLSIELCGFRANGPTQEQVDTVVALVEESKQRYPNMVGAFGHADQTDTKGCPGTAPNMLDLWNRVGHGKFAVGGGSSDMAVQSPGRLVPFTGYEIALPKGRDFFRDSALTDKLGELSEAKTLPYGGAVLEAKSRMVNVITGTPYNDGDPRPTWVYVTDSGAPVPVPAPVPPVPPVAQVLTPGIYEVPKP